MKILIVHNRYRPTAPSGEDAVVDQESSALSVPRPRRRLVSAAQRGNRGLVAGTACHTPGPPALERGFPACDHHVAGPVRAGRRPHPQPLSISDTVGSACLPRRLGPCCRDCPQLQAGLRQRNALPRRPGVPRLPAADPPFTRWPTAAIAARQRRRHRSCSGRGCTAPPGGP